MPARRPSYYLPSLHDPELVAAVGYLDGDPDVVTVHVLDLHAHPEIAERHRIPLDDRSLVPLVLALVGLRFVSLRAFEELAVHRGPLVELSQGAFDLRCLLYALGRDRRELLEGRYDA